MLCLWCLMYCLFTKQLNVYFSLFYRWSNCNWSGNFTQVCIRWNDYLDLFNLDLFNLSDTISWRSHDMLVHNSLIPNIMETNTNSREEVSGDTQYTFLFRIAKVCKWKLCSLITQRNNSQHLHAVVPAISRVGQSFSMAFCHCTQLFHPKEVEWRTLLTCNWYMTM